VGAIAAIAAIGSTGRDPAAAGCCARPPVLVGQTYGPPLAMDYDRDRLAIGVGSTVVLVDVADRARPRLLGRGAPARDLIVDLDLADNLVYAATDGSGLRIFDVLYPPAIREIGALDTPGEANGVVVRDGYAYLADGTAGLRVIDVRDPRAPREVGAQDTPGAAVGVAAGRLSRNLMVADFDGGLRLVDVADPARPRETAHLDLPEGLKAWDVAAAGNYAYVSSQPGGVWAVDVAIPTLPRAVRLTRTDGQAGAIALRNGWVALAGDGLKVLYPLEARAEVAFGATQAYPTVASDGDDLFVVDTSGRLHVVRFLNGAPPEMFEVADLGLLGPDDQVARAPGGLVVAGGQGVRTLDVVAADLPRPLGETGGPVQTHDLAIADRHALIATGGLDYYARDRRSVVVFDLTDAAQPRETGALPMPEAPRDIVVAGRYAYVATGSTYRENGKPRFRGGLRVIDAAAAPSLREVGAVSGTDACERLAVEGDRVYVAGMRWDPRLDRAVPFLRVLDVADPTGPRDLGAIDLPAPGADLAVHDGYAYVAFVEHGDDEGAPAPALGAYDATDPRAIRPAGDLTALGLGGWARSIEIAGDALVLAVHRDLADAGKRRPLAGGPIIVGGLRVVDVEPPETPRLRHAVDIPILDARPSDLAVADGYAYVATGAFGTWIFDLEPDDRVPAPTGVSTATATLSPTAVTSPPATPSPTRTAPATAVPPTAVPTTSPIPLPTSQTPTSQAPTPARTREPTPSTRRIHLPVVYGLRQGALP